MSVDSTLYNCEAQGIKIYTNPLDPSKVSLIIVAKYTDLSLTSNQYSYKFMFSDDAISSTTLTVKTENVYQ